MSPEGLGIGCVGNAILSGHEARIVRPLVKLMSLAYESGEAALAVQVSPLA